MKTPPMRMVRLHFALHLGSGPKLRGGGGPQNAGKKEEQGVLDQLY